MGTVNERKINDIFVRTTIDLCANGDSDAKNYLLSIGYVSRVFDDLIDKDHPVADEQICRAFFILLAELWLNPFFVKNSQLLIPLHIASYNSFVDSNTWSKSDDRLKQIYAHVMKDFANEILGTVAFLTGGFCAMEKASIMVKELFIEGI